MITTVNKKKLYINGQWVEAAQYEELKSPYSLETIAHIPMATDDEVEAAIRTAYAAREEMAAIPAYKRAEMLEKLASLLNERSEEASQIIALEAAKPIKTARLEVARTVQTYKFAAEEAKRIGGEYIPTDAAPGGENRIAYTFREPVGVVAAITPFNFPMNLVAHKVGPALAAGNPVVLKPATQTPLSAYFLGELLHEVGLPQGAFNIVTGNGARVGDKLVTDERVKKISFTGSAAVGIGIRNKAGLKKVTLELGSNAAVIIDDNVELTEAVISRIVSGAFSFQGQVCISVQRIYVHESRYEELVEKLIAETKKLNLGNSLEEATDVSAMISPREVERSLQWIEEAKAAGAEVVTGGKAQDTILQPTILTNVHPSQKVSCQEVFAPIVSVVKVASMDEAIEQVNDSKYGLQAGIYTTNINTALNASKRLQVGGVVINDIPTYRVDHFPYGGVKESGVGREGLKYAIEEMTELKLVIINQN
ncbi:aldehyde dehydrogenase family protein [Solibacillus sp. FSL H8-0538]|uniref:aldehyde dehydrogenase family protein n=1 Tax=Solibacillus sp. FSL H8-0538 TaxID=2921400 RepID=UPI0030F788DF